MTVSASGNGAWCAKQNYQLGEWLQVRRHTKKIELLSDPPFYGQGYVDPS